MVSPEKMRSLLKQALPSLINYRDWIKHQGRSGGDLDDLIAEIVAALQGARKESDK